MPRIQEPPRTAMCQAVSKRWVLHRAKQTQVSAPVKPGVREAETWRVSRYNMSNECYTQDLCNCVPIGEG